MLKIQQDILARIPGLTVLVGRICLSKPAQQDRDAPAALLHWWEQRRVESNRTDSSVDPALAPWLALWESLGLSTKQYPPSILSLLKRAAKGAAPPSINPIVDCYNAISLELKLPLGAFDGHALSGPLELRGSAGGESFRAIGSAYEETTIPGEVVYADSAHILTRHFLWRQSQRACISTTTTEVILVCEMLQEHQKAIRQIRHICEKRIEEHLRPVSVEWVIRP